MSASAAPIRILVAAEYYAFPLWNVDDPPGLDTEQLPIPAELKDAFVSWNREYTNLALDEAVPEAQRRPAFTRLNRQGRSLARELRRVLGEDYEVGYYDFETRETSWEALE